MFAEIVTIGDEILIGQIVDTNSAWLAQELNAEGILVRQISSVADTAAAIAAALTDAAGRADLILITGGLGPTKDDVTKQTLAAYFGCGLRRDARVLTHVEAIFSRYNRPMLEVNRRQADVLESCEVLFNALGTAPGMWQNYGGKIYIIMPGVPFEMKHVMREQVLPRLRQLKGRTPVWHHTMLTGGLGESFLAEKIADIEAALPSHVHLAYLPRPGLVRLRLTATGADQNALKTETQQIANQLKTRISKYFLSEGDVSPESLILTAMRTVGVRLATAESCTGGDIARRLTAIPGSSHAFEGGAVTYSNTLKIQLLGVKSETLQTHGAVSENTVREMAAGAQRNFGVDYAVAVSGVAGPDGGTSQKPVGLVWIAVAGKHRPLTRKYQFGTDRRVNIERAGTAALLLLWQLLITENPTLNK